MPLTGNRDQSHRSVLLAALLNVLTWAGSSSAFAQSTPPETAPSEKTAAAQPADKPADIAKGSPYLRVTEKKGKWIALEIASHDFAPVDKPGPRVGLVAVAHIADRSFYQSVAKLLEEYDVVLFESVKPPGTGGTPDVESGATDAQRIDITKAAMQFVGGMIEAFHAQKKEYPADLKSLEQFATEKDVRLARFLNAALTDGWGHNLIYERTKIEPAKADSPATDLAHDAGAQDAAHATPAKPAEQYTYSLISLGADGKPEGDGPNTDLALADQHPPDPMVLSKEDGLQSQLAGALGLQFQLDSLPYDKANWRCSDMAMDEVNRRLTAKGLDFGMIGGTLAGSSLPAKLIKLFLGFMKMADQFMEGAIADTFKVVMIELLGDPKVLDSGMEQLGSGFGEVIVDDRNQVVIDDLKRLIKREPGVKSVAILYGAAHMTDMSKRLEEQLGYKPMGEDHIRWMQAIKVDLTQSKISASDIDSVRSMMKQMLRQQLKKKR